MLSLDGLEARDGLVEARVAAVRELLLEADGAAAAAAGLGHLVVRPEECHAESHHRGAKVSILFSGASMSDRRDAKDSSGSWGRRPRRRALCLGEGGGVAHDERHRERGEKRVAANETF